MKKRKVEKLINKIDIENSFDKINQNIDYKKYEYGTNTNIESNRKPVMRLAIICASVYAAFIAFFAIDHLSCTTYNNKMIKLQEEVYNVNNNEIYQINSKKDYNNLIGNIEFKYSLLDKLINGTQDKLITPMPDYNEDLESDSPMAPGEALPETDTQTSTNVQTAGIDEADVSKCDGKYIYVLSDSKSWEFNTSFSIFDLQGDLVTKISFYNNKDAYVKNFDELYVYEDTIVLLAQTMTHIYNFDGSSLTLMNSFEYERYESSRLYNNYLYLIATDRFDSETDNYEDLYYDGCSPSYLTYSIFKYDLNTHDYEKVRNLNSGGVDLYTSTNHIYLATQVYINKKHSYIDVLAELTMSSIITVVSIFDYDLNAIGAIRVDGYVLNQFSMDEYNNYFRIVTTKNISVPSRINAISIFDLSNLKKVGYLDENIGEEYQTVRSVRYDTDTCYVVTYETKDPLYEIDLSDVTNPEIVSIYKAPGYSTYLHNFKINDQTYLFGVGFDDDQSVMKISVYIDDGTTTTQIGKDFKMGAYFASDIDLILNSPNYNVVYNHKALFIYNDNENLYLGFGADMENYYIFKIDVDSEDVISVYKQVAFPNGGSYHSRCFLVNGYIYVTERDKLHKQEF